MPHHECGNNLKDHELAGGFEWEGDSRNRLALGEANVRGQPGGAGILPAESRIAGWKPAPQGRGGLIMLAFPDGNVLNASWKVSFAKGQSLRIL